MDDTCYFTFDLKKLDHAPPNPPHPPNPPNPSNLYSEDVCKSKVCYHISVPFQYTPAPPSSTNLGEIVVFSHVKCAWATCHSRRIGRNRCVFSCKMRLGFILTVNLHVIPAHPGEIVLFPAKKKCLGFILIVNLYATDDPPLPTRLFFNENARCTNPRNSFVFSQIIYILRSK